MGELDPRIKIRAPLRCDGIGRLDCAEDLDSGMRLAVRWLPLEANGDAAARACERLPSHPTLPRIRQTGQVGGSAFVAMDFPDGQLLSTRVGERLDTDLVLRIAMQLSDALATMHDQQVVHGEMSSDSVLMVPPDRAYLWDMPLVIANRLTDRRGENRLMQNLVKTAPYLAPERAQGAGASREADVYSLGAVLCIAAGAPMPVASTTLGVVHMVAGGTWYPRVPSSIPDPWRTMLTRMVATDPVNRPTAREVAKVFSQVPVPASLPTVPEFPMVRLPPELMAAADELMGKRSGVEIPNDLAPCRTLEMPLVQSETLARASGTGSAKAPAAEVVTAEAPLAAQAETRLMAALAADAAKVEAAIEAAKAETAKAEAAKLEAAKVEAAALEASKSQTVKLDAVQKAEEPKPELKADAAVVVPLNAFPSVQLTNSISVAHDLASAGAVALDEEIAPRSKLPWLIAAAMAAAIVVLTVIAVNLATRTPVVERPFVAPPVKAAVKAAPAPKVTLPKIVAEEELAPLPAAPVKKAAPVAPRSRPKAAPAAAVVPAAAAPVREAEVKPEPAPVPAQDFSFLDGAEAPKAELKRPEL